MNDPIVAFDYEWREGDRAKAKEIALAYVEEHEEELVKRWGHRDLKDMVAIIEHLRDQGRHSDRIVADMWLLSRFAPQNITGELKINSAQAVIEAAEQILNRAQRRRQK